MNPEMADMRWSFSKVRSENNWRSAVALAR
jgi:hypothetical protein